MVTFTYNFTGNFILLIIQIKLNFYLVWLYNSNFTTSFTSNYR